MIKLDCPIAQKRQVLKDFVEVVQLVAAGEVLSEDSLTDERFDTYRDRLIISKRVSDDDFKFTYWGDSNCRVYGFDLTGLKISEANFGDLEGFFRSLDKTVLERQRRIFLSGLIDWLDIEPIPWYRVALPMQSEDGVDSILSCVCFDTEK